MRENKRPKHLKTLLCTVQFTSKHYSRHVVGNDLNTNENELKTGEGGGGARSADFDELSNKINLSISSPLTCIGKYTTDRD